MLKTYEDTKTVKDKDRSGRPKKLSRGSMTLLKRLVNHKTGVSLRRLGSKFKVSHVTIRNCLKEMNINYFKKKKAPKYTEKQLQEVPTRASRLNEFLSDDDIELVMDDEKYFCLTDKSVPTNRGCYSSDKSQTHCDVKFKRTQKYEPKILVWVAISTKGMSLPFFAKQKQAINEKTYLNNCIKKRLLPFITTYHNKEKVPFWSDLASNHYSKSVRHYLEENGIEFVQRDFNPQNCPQARPIETLWSILKNMVYDQGWEAKTINQLQRRIVKKMKEIDPAVVQSMFSGIQKQLKKIAKDGPYQACSS